jgi:hypothetical protein
MSLVANLRNQRKNPSILRMKLLKIKGRLTDTLIFVFEGGEDIPVYEEWIRRCDLKWRYEPIESCGKEQILALHTQLILEPELLKGVYFFVDRDYDVSQPPSHHLFELDAYSIENLLVCEEVLQSILKDEFSLIGEPELREEFTRKFRQAYSDYLRHCEPVSLLLFGARRTRRAVRLKPERSNEIAQIFLDHAEAAYAKPDAVVKLELEIAADELTTLHNEFGQLPELCRHRGKYCVDFLRRWLGLLYEEARCVASSIFPQQAQRVGRDPCQFTLRRLAGASQVPASLSAFLSAAAIA